MNRRMHSGVLSAAAALAGTPAIADDGEGSRHLRLTFAAMGRLGNLYTADNGRFSHEEDKLGTIEPGKLGDLAELTVVDGKVVYTE